MSDPTVAVYPGTFDPVTNGHIDIITRAARLVDQLIIAVAVNIGKAPLFSVDERVEMVETEINSMQNCSKTSSIAVASRKSRSTTDTRRSATKEATLARFSLGS